MTLRRRFGGQGSVFSGAAGAALIDGGYCRHALLPRLDPNHFTDVAGVDAFTGVG